MPANLTGLLDLSGLIMTTTDSISFLFTTNDRYNTISSTTSNQPSLGSDATG